MQTVTDSPSLCKTFTDRYCRMGNSPAQATAAYASTLRRRIHFLNAMMTSGMVSPALRELKQISYLTNYSFCERLHKWVKMLINLIRSNCLSKDSIDYCLYNINSFHNTLQKQLTRTTSGNNG